MQVSKIFKEFGNTLNDKIKFFIEYYDFEASKYIDNSEDFSVINIHMLIRTIVEELNENGSERNLRFLQKKLGILLKKDFVFKSKFNYRIGQILNNITVNKDYTLQVCNNLEKDLQNGKYGKFICDRLHDILFSQKNLGETKEEIKYLVDVLIIEFAIFGYSRKKIKEIIYEVFDKYSIFEDDKIKESIIITKFPLPNKIKEQSVDIKKQFIEDLDVKDRIKYINKYFDVKKEKTYYVTTVNGIIGNGLNIYLNNVHVYDYKTFPQFNIEKEGQEHWAAEEDFINNKIHCSICVESIVGDSNIEYIKKEVNRALDIINAYHDVKCKIEVDLSTFFIFDNKKEYFAVMKTRLEDEKSNQMVRPLNYSYADTKKLQKIYKGYTKVMLNNNKSTKMIQNSVRYLRKAMESKVSEDKLLNSWICIENIFQFDWKLPDSILIKNERDIKFNNIISTLPTILIRLNLINDCWKTYEYFRNKYSTYGTDGKLLKIPLELAKKCQFTVNKNIKLLKFLDCLEELEEYLTTKLDIDILKFNKKILRDRKVVEEKINKNIEELQEKLIMIYRFRNMIVHNAQFDITFIDFYAKEAENIATKIFRFVLELYLKANKEQSLQEIIIEQYINKMQIKETLKSKDLYDWLKEQD